MSSKSSFKTAHYPFSGLGRSGEICCNGMRYSTDLDEFGVPIISDLIRYAIAKATDGAA